MGGNKKTISVTKMICKCLKMNTKELSTDESFTPSCTVVKLIYISCYVKKGETLIHFKHYKQ